MSEVRDIGKKIGDRILKGIEGISDRDIKKFIDHIIHSRTIYVVGAGRSGLAVRAFAMRLMHLGLNVYVVGEVVTPSIKPGDLLITVSGSGKTISTLNVAKTAKEMGIKTVSITSYDDSPLAKVSDCVVEVRGRSPNKENDYVDRQLTGEHEPLTPMGTLFELTVNVFLDAVITQLMKIYKKGDHELSQRHTNLE